MVAKRRSIRIGKDVSKPDEMQDYTDTSGVTDKVDRTKVKSHSDFFRLFVSLQFLGILCQTTNTCAEVRGADKPKVGKKAPTKECGKQLPQLKYKRISLNDYWSTLPEMSTPMFLMTMARDRFKAILR